MYIKKNVVDHCFIKKINAYLDKVTYESSLWIFPGEHPALYKLIKNDLSIAPFFKSILKRKDCYIVIRMVNKSDSKRSLEAHFDNYTRTFFIPLKIALIEFTLTSTSSSKNQTYLVVHNFKAKLQA